MISKNRQKLIRSLLHKKYRTAERLFIAEGPKVVGDLLAEGFRPVFLMGTDNYLASHKTTVAEIATVSQEELRRMSFLQHPQEVLCIFEMPKQDGSLPTVTNDQLVLALDGIQDPGNLGTIIRIADWFGIQDIVCSLQTADQYNPKVVQATMGSLARVRVTYTDLSQWLDSLPGDVPVYGTLIHGNNLYETPLTPGGIIVMGNEGNGISPEIRDRVTHQLLIPPYPAGHPTADSLNVSIATAVTCAEFRRRSMSAAIPIH